MSFRQFGSSLLLLLAVGCLSGVALAADEHSEGEHAAAVSAEADPGGEHEGEGAHAATDGGEHHDPFEATTHGNAAPQTNPVNGQGNLAEIKTDLAFWSLIVFGCLTAILWKFAWTPICAALDGREKSIQSNIDAAKELNEKAAALLADHEARLAGTADEVRKILDEARRDAETQKEGILAEAQAAAESEKTRALQEIDAAKNSALQELAQKTVSIGVDLASKIVQRQLSPDDHASLISEAIKHFPSKN